MLKRLYIKNFTLIDTLDIDLYEGFSVVTGETGAGKSIVLGAIGLLLGQRADSKALKAGTDKCVIEAHFDLSRYDLKPFFDENDIEYDGDDTIVRRELTAAGKSRAFINDTPVALTMLRELGEQLVDVHSQHQNLLLQKHDFQLSLVDIIAADDALLTDYRRCFDDYQDCCRQLTALQERVEQNRQQQEFLQFQYDELTAARLVCDEQEELERRSDTMTHAEDIKRALYEADNALSGDNSGIVTTLKNATAALHAIERVFPVASELTERMDSSYIELKDIASEVSAHLDDIDFDPAELDTINERLDRLNDLEKKYRVTTVDELITLRDNLARQLADIENSDDTIQQLRNRSDELKSRCQKAADALTRERTKAARKIEEELRQRLVPLGMPNVRFSVDIQPTELRSNGQDQVSLLFSANTSTPLQPVAQVASGGEIARVMLSLKAMISSAVKLPTIIFDEIDTGVSGKMAECMARIMQEMGGHGRQVISITHLPQSAALGTHHYKVYKEETASGTVSYMRELTAEERVGEIAQMLSGSAVSEAAIQNAKELLSATR